MTKNQKRLFMGRNLRGAIRADIHPRGDSASSSGMTSLATTRARRKDPLAIGWTERTGGVLTARECLTLARPLLRGELSILAGRLAMVLRMHSGRRSSIDPASLVPPVSEAVSPSGSAVRRPRLGWRTVPDRVRVTVYNDAGCPWGYSANPALRVLEWRYGAQLEWRLVLIGLTNAAQEYVDRGYTPLRSAEGYARRFRRFGMPLAPNPRARIVGTGRSCRAVVAVRLQAPGSGVGSLPGAAICVLHDHAASR